jgi:acetylornithine/succinyldiaminopimelate/putrescine aminotransferase/predicted amino acid dehydrogenase
MLNAAPSIVRRDLLEEGIAAQLRLTAIVIDRALSRAGGSLEQCALALLPVGEDGLGPVEEVGGIFSIRSRDGRRRLLRAGACRERIVPQIPELDGRTVNVEGFARWLDEYGLAAALSCAASPGTVSIGDRAASLSLDVGTVANAEAIAAALVAAFALSPLANRLAGEGVLIPLGVGHVCRRAVEPVRRAVAVLRAERARRIYVDCCLLDARDQVVLSLVNIGFVPFADAEKWATFDLQATAAAGLAATEARLLGMFATLLAELLEMEEDLVPLDAPLSAMGVDSLSAVELRNQAALVLGAELPLDRLSPSATLGDFARVAAAELVRLYAPQDDPYGVARYLNPAMVQSLRIARLDRAYVRGVGSILTDNDGRDVIDFVAQYGALPFGHNPPPIWDALIALHDRQAPVMMGLSIPVAAGRLAERLTSLAPPGLDRAFFCSSGTEAIEAAIKLARAATGRSGVLSTIGGFHGLTLGALSATGREVFHRSFGAPLEEFDKVPFANIDALTAAVKREPTKYAVFIVEPIQSEGGVIEPPPGYHAAAAALCRAHGIVFVMDEIQTGLGRCGHLFVSSAFGVEPDVITLAKALGGGVVPMGAVLYRSALATRAFMLRHGSTFANNAVGCAAAMATIDRLTANDSQILRWVNERGAWLKSEAQAIQRRHPQIVREIRGRGYLLGAAFSDDPNAYDGSIAALMCGSEGFAIILASYLLERHGVRVAPVMNCGSVLRIEPALDVPPSLFAPLLDGMEQLAEALDRGDSPAVLGHILGLDPADAVPFTDRRTRVSPAQAPAPATAVDGKFAFLIHLMGGEDLASIDPSLANLQSDAMASIRQAAQDHFQPIILRSFAFSTSDGRRAVGDLILIPLTAQDLLDMPSARARQVIEEAIGLAARRGAQIVGLGGFTSVVTDGGRAIGAHAPVAITTGNALTALTALQAIKAARGIVGDDVVPTTAMVFGAFGSIGAALTKLLARHVTRLVLVVRRENETVLRQRADALRHDLIKNLASANLSSASVAAALASATDGAEAFIVTSDPAPYWEASGIVVTATSALSELVSATNLAPGAVVCDVSRPMNVARDLMDRRPDVVLIEGGVLVPPPPFDCGIDLGIGRDRSYACMAETMLLAVERDTSHVTFGSEIDLGAIPWLDQASRRAGFSLPERFSIPKRL